MLKYSHIFLGLLSLQFFICKAEKMKAFLRCGDVNGLPQRCAEEGAAIFMDSFYLLWSKAQEPGPERHKARADWTVSCPSGDTGKLWVHLLSRPHKASHSDRAAVPQCRPWPWATKQLWGGGVGVAPQIILTVVTAKWQVHWTELEQNIICIMWKRPETWEKYLFFFFSFYSCRKEKIYISNMETLLYLKFV